MGSSVIGKAILDVLAMPYTAGIALPCGSHSAQALAECSAVFSVAGWVTA